MLEQPFGKENLTQCFKLQASLRLILLPLLRSGFIDTTNSDWQNLADAVPLANMLSDLLHEFGSVDFSSLRGFFP